MYHWNFRHHLKHPSAGCTAARIRTRIREVLEIHYTIPWRHSSSACCVGYGTHGTQDACGVTASSAAQDTQRCAWSDAPPRSRLWSLHLIPSARYTLPIPQTSHTARGTGHHGIHRCPKSPCVWGGSVSFDGHAGWTRGSLIPVLRDCFSAGARGVGWCVGWTTRLRCVGRLWILLPGCLTHRYHKWTSAVRIGAQTRAPGAHNGGSRIGRAPGLYHLRKHSVTARPSTTRYSGPPLPPSWATSVCHAGGGSVAGGVGSVARCRKCGSGRVLSVGSRRCRSETPKPLFDQSRYESV